MNGRVTASVVAVVGLLLAVGLVFHHRPGSETSRPVSASGSGSTGARPGRLGVAPTPPPSGGLRIQGVVLDDQGPVAGVRVSASRPEAGQTLSELPCPPDEDFALSDDAPRLLPACVDESTSLILELTGAREGEAPVYAEAVTGGDGTFVLEGLPPGSFTLWALGEQGAVSRTAVPAGGEGVELRLGEGVTLEGLVFGEEAPLPEARVTVIHVGHTRFFDARTDADGRFRIGPLPASRYLLAISAEGWMPGLFTSEMLDEPESRLELFRPRRITGRVLSGGVPAPGVEVLLEPLSLGREARRVRTDAEGRFLFESLPMDYYRLTVEEAGRFALAHLTDDMPWSDVVLELGKAFLVEGTVRDEAGRPVSGAYVRSHLLGGMVAFWFQNARTGPDGRYRLGPMVPGPHTFNIEAERHRPVAAQEHELAEGSGPVDFTLERASSVQGTVVDTDGQPLAHIALSLLRPGRPNPRHGNTVASTRSDAEGRFVLDAFAAGPYLLDVRDETVLAEELEVEAPSEGVRVVLRRGGSVAGSFTDHQGIPLTQGSVLLWDLGAKGGAVRTAVVDQEGRFLLRGVAPGRYMLEASHLTAGMERSAARSVEVRDGEQVEASLQLEVGRTLSGVVVDGAGQPVAGALLSASPTSVPSWQRVSEDVVVTVQDMPSDVRSGPDGRFILNHLGAEAYDVFARKEGYRRPGGQAVRVGAGTSEVRVVLERLGRIRGRLVDPTGAPITWFKVNEQTQKEPGGAFSVIFHESGTESLSIHAPEMAPVLRSVPVRDGIDVDLGELRMGPGRTVRGRVLDAETSEPMPALIRFTDTTLDSKSPTSSLLWRTVVVEEDGAFVLSNVEARPLTLVVEHPDYWPKRLTLDERTEELTVRLETGAQVEVRVRDTQGQLMGASLDFERDGGGNRGSYLPEGTEVLRGLQPGHYTVRVLPIESDLPPVFFRPRRVEVPARGRLSLTFDAEQGGTTVRLTVRDPKVRSVWLRSGSTPPIVTSLDLEEGLSGSATAGREGESDEHWVLDHVPPGPATLLLVQESFESRFHREELVIPAGGTLSREVRPVWRVLAHDED
ncbi:carboxypeptidase regulatory-like domain-containing protein [Archangium sp.]|uniref:carboxypeptidase regulatory-like domain-containing protein n=1 Tax=Archangium sp. TaxID=1872627 RepID=UPI00286A5F92|nr:carboxypeptidase regulatory-like domain-containing protein [Archangium sp.]